MSSIFKFFYSQKYNVNTVIAYLIILQFTTVYFSMALPNFLLALIVVLFFTSSNKKKKKQFKKGNIIFLLISVPFVLTAISVLCSDNIYTGLGFLWLRLPLIILPFIIISLRETFKRRINELMSFFVLISLLGGFIAIYNVIDVFFEYGTLLDPNHTKKFITPIQHSYFGVFQFSAVILIFEFNLFRNKSHLTILAVFLLVFGVIISTSRISYLMLISYTLYKVATHFSTKTLIFTFLATTGSFIFIINSNQPLLKKVTNTFSYWHSPRVWYWHNSYKVIKHSDNIFFGIGIGDFYELKRLPHKFQHTEKGSFGFNPHNQFVEFIITNGALGFIYLFVFLYFLKTSFTTKNIFPLLIILVIFTFSLTESILTRQYGVMFYSFFFPLALLFTLPPVLEKK